MFKVNFSVVVGVGLQFDCKFLCRVWNGLAFEDRGDVVDERGVVALSCCPRGVGKEEILANQVAGFSVNFVFGRVPTCKKGKIVVVQPLRARQVGGLGRRVGEGFCGRFWARKLALFVIMRKLGPSSRARRFFSFGDHSAAFDGKWRNIVSLCAFV